MEFKIDRTVLQKELGFVQGIVEKRNTIPVLANILIESIGEKSIRIFGTDLDATIRCDAEIVELTKSGSMCVQAQKLFDIVRLLQEPLVTFKLEPNSWVEVRSGKAVFRVPGVAREQFPELPGFKSAPFKLPGDIFKSFVVKTIFAITQEESRYTLSGAKFILDQTGAKMITTDGHRLAFIARADIGDIPPTETLEALIPRKTLAELLKLTGDAETAVSFGVDDNHIYFEVGSRLLISRKLSGQFPNYDMVMPKNNDKAVTVDAVALSQSLKRVALMADDVSRGVRVSISEGQIGIVSQSAEEGEASDTIQADYVGESVDIGFNAQYLLDFLNVIGSANVVIEFRDGNSQAQLRPAEASEYDYRYVVMPMRI